MTPSGTGGSSLRAGLVDAACLGALLALALLGFRATYGNNDYLYAGLAGILLGLVISAVGERLRAPAIAIAATAVVVFLLLGSVIAVRGAAASGVLPSGAGLRAVVDGVLRGWRDLLTVLPPVGSSGNVLAIPYLLGLSGAVLGLTTARRTRLVVVPLLPAVLVLGLSILFGGAQPTALIMQGSAFAGIALFWMALRSRATDLIPVRATYRNRASAAALVAGAAAGSVIVGPLLPLAGAHQRVVLRDYVEPPLDLRDYVSPLATYRKFVVPTGRSANRGSLGDTPLFTVEGLPAGALIRIATMDSYDGNVWSVAGATVPSATEQVGGSGAFQRVGETIPTTAAGPRATVTFTLGALGGIWLPSVGVVTRARFHGVAGAQLASTFRYNRATDSAVAATLPVDQPRALRAGDTYTIEVIVPPEGMAVPQVDRAALAAAGPGTTRTPEPARVPESVKAKLAEIVAETQGTFARVQMLADELARGAYSNGTEGEIGSLAGHYAARLDRMVSDPQGLVGDAEQYAALMAVMTQRLGIPARVVMGVRPLDNATPVRQVKGNEVTAWVEVGLEGLGWVPVFPTPASTAKKPQTVPRPKPITRVQEPPKSAVAPRLAADPRTEEEVVEARKTPVRKAPALAKPAEPERPGTRRNRVPLFISIAGAGVPLLIMLMLLAAKWRRRFRRRTQGSPSTRIAGGWSELMDFLTDAGVAVPRQANRVDAAAAIGQPLVSGLAGRADAAVFAPDDPSESDVAAYWDDVRTARRGVAGELGLGSRVRRSLNLASLRR